MSEPKFTSKDFVRQLRQTPDLAYEFSKKEVLEGIKLFLQYVGYAMEEEGPGEDKADFSARRRETGRTYQIAGVVRHDMKEVADGVVCLKKLKEELAESATDYAIVLPPVQERHLIDYLMADRYRLFKDLQENRMMLWLCNPQERSVMCAQGAPTDKRFDDYFRRKPVAGGIIAALAMQHNCAERWSMEDELMKEMMEE